VREEEEEDVAGLWCTCHAPDDGSLMICCENDECPVQWYHGACVGLKKEPVGAWWCGTCVPAHAPVSATSATSVVRSTRGKGRQSTSGKKGAVTKGISAKVIAKGKKKRKNV
jgi:hypothetical protein